MASITAPDTNDAKRTVNEKLLRIKSEHAESEYDFTADEDDANSQTIRPQQFFQDLDDSLIGLPRETYVKELLRLCRSDYSEINDYRERLADRARGFPDCPETRLVSRRNSSHTSRQRKCANDCYVLNAFVNGERLKEIFDVFSSGQSQANETILLDDEPDPRDNSNTLTEPDALAMLTQIRAEVTEISKRQKSDTSVLNDLRREICKLSTLFSTVQATLNSILARAPLETSSFQLTKIQSDINKIGSSLTAMSRRFPDNADTAETETTRAGTGGTSEPYIARTNKKSYSDTVTERPNTPTSDVIPTRKKTVPTRSATTLQPPSNRPASRSKPEPPAPDHHVAPSINDEPIFPPTDGSISISINATDIDIDSQAIDKPCVEETAPTQNRFIAAGRRISNSYFIGNIHQSVDEMSIREFLKEKGVRPSHIKMFFGRNGSSARINFYIEDAATVEDPNFWPSKVTCRKWVNRSEWEDNKEQRTRRRNRYRNSNDDRANADDQRSPYYQKYRKDDYYRDDYNNTYRGPYEYDNQHDDSAKGRKKSTWEPDYDW